MHGLSGIIFMSEWRSCIRKILRAVKPSLTLKPGCWSFSSQTKSPLTFWVQSPLRPRQINRNKLQVYGPFALQMSTMLLIAYICGWCFVSVCSCPFKQPPVKGGTTLRFALSSLLIATMHAAGDHSGGLLLFVQSLKSGIQRS